VKRKRLIICGTCITWLLMVCGQPSAEPDAGLSATPDGPEQWTLPKFLRETSGLAPAGPGFLLAHNDEKANVYRIDIENRSVIKLASVGKPPLRGDFEGIAFDGQQVFLATSNGIIYVIPGTHPSNKKQVVTARKMDTGLGKQCELEGLHYIDGRLLLPCKNPLNPEHRNRLVVFSYDLATKSTSLLVSLDKDSIPGLKKLRLTAVEQVDDTLYLVSANRLLLIDLKDNSTRAFKLHKKYHEQIEAIAVTPQGIYLAEDNSKGRSRLTRYNSVEDLEEKISKSVVGGISN
jgi:hypothetical protein